MKTLRGALWLGVWKKNRLPIILVTALIIFFSVFNHLFIRNGWVNPESIVPEVIHGNGFTQFINPNPQILSWGSWVLPINYGSIPLIETIAMLLSFIAVFAIFGFVEDLPRKGVSGLSPVLFRLPVRTRQLAYEATLAGTVGIIACFVLWEYLVLIPLHYAWPVVCSITLLAAAAAGFQAILWSLPSFPGLRLGTMALGASGFLAWFLRLKMQPLSVEQASMATLLHGGLLLLFTEIGVRGAALERQGFWVSWTWRWPERRTLLELPLPRLRAHASWFGTQLYREFRVNAAGPILAFFGMVAVIAWNADNIRRIPDGGILGPDRLIGWFSESSFDIGSLFGFWLPVGATSLIGMRLARDVASRRYGISQFLATRPVTVWKLWLPKVLLVALLALGVNAVCFWCGWVGGEHAQSITLVRPSVRMQRVLQTDMELHRQPGLATAREIRVSDARVSDYFHGIILTMSMPIAMAILMTMVSFSLGTLLWPLSVWCRGFPWSLILYGVTVVPLVFCYPWFEWSYYRPTTHGIVVAVLFAAWIGKFLLAGGSLVTAHRRGVFGRGTILGIVLLWLGLASGLAMIFSQSQMPNLWIHAILFLPLSRFALATLALDYARHQLVAAR